MQDWQPVRELVVQICGITQTTGTVTVPGLSYSASFSIPSGGGLATVTVPASCQMSTMDGIENSAVHVVAGAPVQVQASDWLPYMSEGFMAMPSANVGNNYVVVAYPTQAMQQEGVSYGSGRFSIVAVADNTTATITPSVDCGSHLAGVPFTVTLSTGQAYELMEPTVGSDLTGTTITSDNNVVVFGGAQGAYVPIGAPQANPLTEQIPSVDRLWNSYIITPYATRMGGDDIRVVGVRNNTTVWLNGTVIAVLRRGQCIDEFVSAPGYLTADKPVLVAQISQGSSADGNGIADPCMTILAGTNQYLSSVTFVSPVNQAWQYVYPDYCYYVNLVVANSGVGLATLDGTLIPASSFTQVGSSGYSAAQISTYPGAHITAAGGYAVNATTYFYGIQDGIAFPGEESLAINTGWSWTPPNAPTNLLATPVSGTQIRLTWMANNPSSMLYEVQRELSPGGKWRTVGTVPLTIYPGTVAAYTDGGLSPSTAYNYRVRASADLNSAWSNVASATTPNVPPDAPTNLIATPVSGPAVNLTWNDSGVNEAGLHLQRSLDGATWMTVQTLLPGSTNCQDTTVSALTTYYYRIGAFNAYGENFSFTASVTTLAGPPTAPSNLVATATAYDQVNLSWGASTPNIGFYTIIRQTGSGGFYFAGQVPGSVTAFQDNSVSGATSYAYYVYAWNAAGGYSPLSNLAQVTTPNPPPPAAPSSLVAVATDFDEIDLNWTNNDLTQTGVEVQRSLHGQNEWSNVAALGRSATTYADTGLTASTAYDYRVYAFNAGGSSAFSNVASATTPVGPPPGSTPYLRQITAQPDFLVGPGTVTATAKLSMTTTSPLTITLWTPDPNLSCPNSVTVPAGQKSVSFQVSVGQVSGIDVGFVYGSDGNWCQCAKVASANSPSELPTPSATAIGGNGGIWVQWPATELNIFGQTVSGYQVYRSANNGPAIPMLTVSTSTNSFVDTSTTPGVNYVYTVSLECSDGTRLAQGAPSPPTGASGPAAVTWTSVPTGTVNGTVTLLATNPNLLQSAYDVYADGLRVGTATANAEAGDSAGVISLSLDTTQLANGTHMVWLASSWGVATCAASAQVQLTTLNGLTMSSGDGIEETDTSDLVETASCANGAASGYTITLTDENGSALRTWYGFGGQPRLVWDGKIGSGSPAPDGTYTLTTTSSGGPGGKGSLQITKVGAAPKFLAVVTVHPNFWENFALAYASSVRRSLKSLSSSNGNFPYAQLTIYANMRVSRQYATMLKKWLGSSVNYLYWQGHAFSTTNEMNELEFGFNVRVVNYDVTSDWQKISVPRISRPGQYKFAFLDVCGSDGYKHGSDETDEWGSNMTSSPPQPTWWGAAFKLDLSGFDNAGFVAGNDGSAYFGGPAGCNRSWYDWRGLFWQALVRGNSAQDSVQIAGWDLPSWEIEPRPSSFSMIVQAMKLNWWGGFGGAGGW
ncbi:MAG TPA: fibronectin type III domain-containing protein [Fimbriimonadaceae bacterium]|nr:fibronectin type III domain-containing protein [Fimbriimonadaceae bacterium]